MATNGRDNDLTWHDINTEHKSESLRKLRDAHVKAADAAKRARTAYEDALRQGLYASKAVMDTHEIILTHRFGQLRYATRLKSDTSKASGKAKEGVISL